MNQWLFLTRGGWSFISLMLHRIPMGQNLPVTVNSSSFCSTVTRSPALHTSQSSRQAIGDEEGEESERSGRVEKGKSEKCTVVLNGRRTGEFSNVPT